MTPSGGCRRVSVTSPGSQGDLKAMPWPSLANLPVRTSPPSRILTCAYSRTRAVDGPRRLNKMRGTSAALTKSPRASQPWNGSTGLPDWKEGRTPPPVVSGKGSSLLTPAMVPECGRGPSSHRPLAQQFSKLLQRLNINGRRGFGFSTLRHNFQTIGGDLSVASWTALPAWKGTCRLALKNDSLYPFYESVSWPILRARHRPTGCRSCFVKR